MQDALDIGLCSSRWLCARIFFRRSSRGRKFIKPRCSSSGQIALPLKQSAHMASPSITAAAGTSMPARRSEEHTSELQSHLNLVCRLLLEKKKQKTRDLSRQDDRATACCQPEECRGRRVANSAHSASGHESQYGSVSRYPCHDVSVTTPIR